MDTTNNSANLLSKRLNSNQTILITKDELDYKDDLQICKAILYKEIFDTK